MINFDKQLNFFGTDPEIENPVECASPAQTAWKMHIDGASRNNPGKAGAGFVLQQGDVKSCEQGFFVGHRTNNQAEYFALLLGLFFAKEYLKKQDSLLIYSDSQLLVRQMTGIYKIRDPLLQKMRIVALQLMVDYKVTFCHVYRENNVRADLLANRGIDKMVLMPKKFIDTLLVHDIV
jgi:ribonuclease HI